MPSAKWQTYWDVFWNMNSGQHFMDSQETQRGGISSWLCRKRCLDQVFLFLFSNRCWSRAAGAELHFCRDLAQVLRAVAREGTDEPLAALWPLLSVGCTRLGTHHRRAAALPGALPAGKPDSTRNRSFHSGISHWNPCSWKASCSLFWKSSWKLHPVHPWREGGACQWHWAQAGTAGTAPVHLGFNCSDCPQSLSGEMQNWGTALLLSTGISWKITHNNRLSSSQRAIHFLVWL